MFQQLVLVLLLFRCIQTLSYGTSGKCLFILGSSPDSAAKSCFDIYETGSSLSNGIYWIGSSRESAVQVHTPSPSNCIDVLCERRHDQLATFLCHF